MPFIKNNSNGVCTRCERGRKAAISTSRVVRFDKPTREVTDTPIDPSDPNAKQKAIHKAPASFEEYLKQRAAKEAEERK